MLRGECLTVGAYTTPSLFCAKIFENKELGLDLKHCRKTMKAQAIWPGLDY